MAPENSSDLHAFIEVKQKKHTFYLLKLSASKLVHISYASIRGKSEEDGAVQRVLNTRRIASLRDFAEGGGDYAASVVLNWVHPNHRLTPKDQNLQIPNEERSAQIIDGQHRIAGLRDAIAKNPNLGEIEIPVSLYQGLDNSGCAAIFLSINTEQRAAPRSLVIDLYGVTDEPTADPATLRARDIAILLHDHEESPFTNFVRMPGADRGQKGVALSTMVAAIKPLVVSKGPLAQYGLSELELQLKAVLNFFKSLQSKYGDTWSNTNQNVFLSGVGFTGAMFFFSSKLIPYCAKQNNFTLEFMSKSLEMDKKTLILPGVTRGLSGKAGADRVMELLTDRFVIDANPTKAIRI